MLGAAGGGGTEGGSRPQDPERQGADGNLRPPRPPLKWAGGKRWLIPHLRPLWEPYRERRLVEPLCGGLAVAMGLRPARALLNDISPHAWNFYRWVKRGLVIELPMRNEAALYYAYRERFNRLIADGGAKNAEAASLFYYLNRTCYNGLCRFNSRGEFNVPFGRYGTINYRRDFSAYRAEFAQWEFTSGDFARVELEPDDFVYADPPYDVEFTRYAKEDFGWEDQERLAGFLARHPGPVLISNQATPRIVELYRSEGFELHFLEAPRRISCKERRPAAEVLASRNL
jgi:DNA adenine methylase